MYIYSNSSTLLDLSHLKKIFLTKVGRHTGTNWGYDICITFQQQRPYKDNCGNLLSQGLQVFDNLEIYCSTDYFIPHDLLDSLILLLEYR